MCFCDNWDVTILVNHAALNLKHILFIEFTNRTLIITCSMEMQKDDVA